MTSTLSITASKISSRGPKRCPGEHAHDHPLLVLGRLVAEPDRRGLAPAAELVGDDRGVEVERVGGHGVSRLARSPSRRIIEGSDPSKPAREPGGPSPAPRDTTAAGGASSSGSQRVSATSCACSGAMCAEPAGAIAEEVEADDLEDPLALPRVDVAHVPELLDQRVATPGLLGDLPARRVGRLLAGADVPLRERPDPGLAAGPDRGDVPRATQPTDDDATGRELAASTPILSLALGCTECQDAACQTCSRPR